ncbi:MAG: CHAT domain-containing protein, partial [Pseudonocardiaceae bacterium]
MADRLLVDLGADGRVSVSTLLDGEISPTPAGEPFELVWPLDTDALEDLRWYLEDYLRAPFGVYGERGPQVAGRLSQWGQAVFAAIFGVGPARDAYLLARAGTDLEIVFRSSVPARLGLPWELVCDPARPTPVALDRVGMSRSLLETGALRSFTVGGARLRVLMVISRPKGAADVGYRMIARPLLERLDAVRGNVDLVVLRPPTLERLGEELAAARAAREPFQIVHFDGHGVLAGGRVVPGSGAPLTFEDSAEQGILVFEKPGGGADQVPAAEVARVLAGAQVPVVVLNACQSGAVGKALEAAVATRLLQEGAASVVAMAYSVYAVAAAEFMAAFYERLFAGDRVTDAISAGRRRLAQRPERPSPKGPLPLADWVVPVHYARRDVRFPDLQTSRSAGVSLEQMLDQLRKRTTEDSDVALAGVGDFVGRDGLFYTLEVAARLQRVVLLHGPAGTGKTELARAFGRWWRDTGAVARPEWVIWHSFEPGVASFGLDGVLAAIGLRVFGTDFARLDPTHRRDVVLRLLTEQRLLLIWDNFEAVHSMPDPASATPTLDKTGRDELQDFLTRVAATGPSAVIITSRNEETWLGQLRRIPVGGLTPDETIDYADQLLAPYPATTPRRAQRAFAELIDWLDGHPLSMRLLLPQLDTTDPQALLAGLRGITPLPGGDNGGRTTSLAASITYSFTHLSPDTQRLLVAISLFQGVADVGVLSIFSKMPDVPQRFRECATAAWAVVLDQAVAVGLLTSLGRDMYGIHPALPAYLVQQWRREEPDDYSQQRAAADDALLDAYAAFGAWLSQQIQAGDAAFAFAVLNRQRHTLGNLLANALGTGRWNQAQAIALPLNEHWDARGLYEEARGWVDRALQELEAADGTPPPVDDPAGALWLFFTSSQANRQLTAHQLDSAERTYLDICDMLQAHPESTQQLRRLAITYHQLGMVALDRGHLNDAEHWYHQSLTIEEELANRPGMAGAYHQLGRVALNLSRLEDAERWYHQALTISEELGNRPGMARVYHQLGVVAQFR